ncbi:6-pyruvoyl tetrahydropterin synthase family protein [Streptomyces lavendulae]|uniref:6-pyruvoyl trahydropterin synthase family protein n=1 Tax=Streptomyces lavendulae TaxID=1914 RepID=UPI0024A34FF6|nr:6-carboxytetrahydropterin synthase [Streptomyces lavendulae]GLW04725.1 6-pyruvoyl tetrahydrobiopterin synthase [Streptomyces lavendulae subsp. lavendulae]
MNRHKVTKTIDFCYGHRLLNYSGKCRQLHGHNGLLEVDLASDDLDDLGMVVDFTDVKEKMRSWVHDHLDHQVLLHREDPLVPLLTGAGQPVFLMDTNPTAENVAALLWDVARDSGLPVTETRLWETSSSRASYRGGE